MRKSASVLLPKKLQVPSSKLEVSSSEHEVSSSEHEVSSSEHEVSSSKLEVSCSKLEVSSSKLEVSSSKLEVSSSEHEVPSSEHEVSSSEHEVSSLIPYPSIKSHKQHRNNRRDVPPERLYNVCPNAGYDIKHEVSCSKLETIFGSVTHPTKIAH
ncbi:hypothetical protein PI95_005345 [Hassallia byssoidea VB512170]|uniref:Uncharacterized protein n=1 Tax=Hassallia byssoidea VB512170 TaxID=1304833 RepID=A0A846H608_9CYAN|nr:hypothetical protein [Hassalia byssoidea]NEU72011.1 hypothetical protein [Hassalia byssoidea VB512170]